MKIGASILDVDYLELKDIVSIIEESETDSIHLDVMDGNFVPSISFGSKMIKAIKNHTDLFLDYHLMVCNPINIIDELIEIGVNQITIHIESDGDIFKMLKKIQKNDIKVGIAINPNTDIDLIKPFLNIVDTVLQMTVFPGKGGQSFIEKTMMRTKYLSKYKAHFNLNYTIQVDGGINNESILLCKENGVDSVVVGSYLFKSNILNNQIKLLKNDK